MIYGNITGLKKRISKIILGNDFQKKFIKAEKLWDFYFSKGGNTFDNSIYYRDGLSDQLLSKWIKSRSLEKEIVLISKIGQENTKPSEILELLNISLDRYDVDSIDILILHHDNINVPIGEFIDSLNELKKKKLIKSFGASNLSKARYLESLEWSKKNNKDTFNILSNNLSLAKIEKPLWKDCVSSNNDEFLRLLEKNKTSHFAWSSQARGFFMEDNFINKILRRKLHQDLKKSFISESNLERKKRAKILAKKYQCSANDVALSWVMCQNFPSYAIIGPKNINQLKYSLNSLNIELTSKEIEWLNLKSDC